jgi:hypothetical protein
MSYSDDYRFGDTFVDDGEEIEMVTKVREQLEINRMKIARISSMLTTERIHAIVGGISLLILVCILAFSLFATVYPRLTAVEIDPQVLVALIIPSVILASFGFLTFFTDAIARMHELRQLEGWNLRAIHEALRALDDRDEREVPGRLSTT